MKAKIEKHKSAKDSNQIERRTQFDRNNSIEFFYNIT